VPAAIWIFPEEGHDWVASTRSGGKGLPKRLVIITYSLPTARGRRALFILTGRLFRRFFVFIFLIVARFSGQKAC